MKTNASLIQLYSLDGRKVLEKDSNFETNVDIDISSISNGSYIIIVKGKQLYQSKLLIIFIVSDLNFEFAFGQHSGVIDPTKDFLEMPRFPINEKYGELKRFNSILQTLPFPYESITPENRYLKKDENPPEIKIKFFENLINIKNINCYSNEGNIWRKSDIQFIGKNEIMILLKEKFKSERGRINCSLWEKSENGGG